MEHNEEPMKVYDPVAAEYNEMIPMWKDIATNDRIH